MTYLDKLLSSLVANHQAELNRVVPARDASTLTSLANSVVGQYFITENQSRLLIKLLRDNQHLFGVDMSKQIREALDTPMWSRPFRVIEQVKKMYINAIGDGDPFISIDFTFSANIRKAITQANKDIENLVQEANGKSYIASLTERNIVTLVDLLRPLGFDIDETLLQYYDTIKSWNVEDVLGQYHIDTMTSKNFHKCIADDLGVDTAIDENIIHDRSFRYKYVPRKELIHDDTLICKLASRNKSRIWVNRKEHSLTELVKTLADLKRLPVMFVFDSYDQTNAHELLAQVADALDANNIDGRVGVYFRLPNTENGTKFNEIIAKRQYNQYLDVDTAVVGVQSGKIPKFFLNTSWKPMSVVAINTQLRSSKTAVYASCCDLIVTYSDTEPMIEKSERWL